MSIYLKNIKDIYISSTLHDIGKAGITDAIKPGKLTDNEFNIIKNHVKLGRETLTMMDKQVDKQSFLTLAKEIAFNHHERRDGNGYLHGFKGDKIPLSARIVSVADVYNTLASKLVYKDAIEHKNLLKLYIKKKANYSIHYLLRYL